MNSLHRPSIIASGGGGFKLNRQTGYMGFHPDILLKFRKKLIPRLLKDQIFSILTALFNPST